MIISLIAAARKLENPNTVLANKRQWNLGVVDVFAAICVPFRFPLDVVGLKVGRRKKVDFLNFNAVVYRENPWHLAILRDDDFAATDLT